VSAAQGRGRRGGRERPAWGKLIALVLFFISLFLVWRYTPLADYVEPQSAIAWARSIGELWWSPLIVIVAYTPAAFIMFPRPLITLFAVIAYGPLMGFATAMSGIAVAALCMHSVGRALPADTVRRFAGRKFERITPVLRRHGLVASFAMSIAAIAPFPVEGMAAGAIGLRLWHYLLGTMGGMLPGTLFTTVLADELQTALDDPAQVNYWLIGIGLMLIIGLTLWVRRSVIRLQEDAESERQQRVAGGSA
jgi:phospholipase D1/2